MARIAVVGCGSIGQRHIANLRKLGEEDLVAYDPLPAAREHVRGSRVRVVDALSKVWAAAPAIVVIAAPTSEHLDLASAAVDRGCDLFVEKPLWHRLEGVRRLIADAEDRRLITMVACNMRFHPGPSAMKAILDEGGIGRVLAARLHAGSFLPRWRPWQDHRESYSASAESGGVIFDLIHEIDIALWELGPARVLAAVTRPATSIGLSTDGIAEILLEHSGGTITSLHLSFVERDYRRSHLAIGTDGTVAWDFASGTVTVQGLDGEVVRIERQPDRWELNDMYVDEMRHFLACVGERRPTVNPLASAEAALRVAVDAKARGAMAG